MKRVSFQGCAFGHDAVACCFSTDVQPPDEPTRGTGVVSFSGHETFTMRHGWLKKAIDAVQSDAHSLRQGQRHGGSWCRKEYGPIDSPLVPGR